MFSHKQVQVGVVVHIHPAPPTNSSRPVVSSRIFLERVVGLPDKQLGAKTIASEMRVGMEQILFLVLAKSPRDADMQSMTMSKLHCLPRPRMSRLLCFRTMRWDGLCR